MSSRIRNLQAKKAVDVKAARALTDLAETEGRDLTAEEQSRFGALETAITTVNASLEREQLIAAEEVAMGAAAGTVVVSAIGAVIENKAADLTAGFKSFGDFAQAVKTAGQIGAGYGGVPDPRLGFGAAVPATSGNEGAGADGGFTVPPQFATEIYRLSLIDDAFLPMTDNTPVSGNGMVFPKDETTPWGTNGVRAYWQAEATAANATKPVFGVQAMRLHKLMALMPISNELLEDSMALGAYLQPLAGRSITWKTNEAILFGNGNGQPVGLFTGNAAVVQAKDANQATLTLSTMNIANMIARLMPGSYSKSIWLITPDLLPSLFTLTLGNYPIYLPPSTGVQGNPYGTLMGRPIIVSQHAPAFTSQGDISLVDFNYYRTITKAAGVQVEQSMHLYFDADATAFRATFRLDGSPKIVAPITQAKGSKTLSPFVQLQAR
jgi:HK97 family phage major capsid protein